MMTTERAGIRLITETAAVACLDAVEVHCHKLATCQVLGPDCGANIGDRAALRMTRSNRASRQPPSSWPSAV